MDQNQTTTSTVLLNGEQAKSELAAIEAKVISLRKNMREATKVGDVEGWKKLKKELDDTQKKMKEVRRESFDAKKVLDDLSGSSLKDLEAAQKKIQNLMRNGTVKRHTKEWDELREANIRVKKEIENVSVEMGIGMSASEKFSSSLSMIPGNIGGIINSVKAMGSALKSFFLTPAGFVIGAIALLGSAFVSLVKNSMEFSKAVSELKALTGATGNDLKYLKDQAKLLGSQYGKSATEIVTAMKLVGSAKPELLKNVEALSQMTEASIVLSKATGMGMEDTTNNLTTIMNQFGLSAMEGDRVINTLAAGSKFGAKEVDYLGESISKVGVTMKSAGIELETGVAIMELFGEKGVKAETAGNGFKKVLVELQSDTKNYTNGVFDLNKAIENNQSIAGDNIALQKKFGTEFFGLAQILFQNKERFMELNEQVKGTNTALEMYADATDNLAGDISKLSGSWDSFMLSLEDGSGVLAKTARSFVQLADSIVKAWTFLTKSSQEKEDDAITAYVTKRMEDIKKTLSTEKNKVKYIREEIDIELDNLHDYNKRANEIGKEMDGFGEMYRDTKKYRELEKQFNSLQDNAKRSAATVKQLVALRNSLTEKPVDEKNNKKNTTTGGDKPTKTPYEKELELLENNLKDQEAIYKKAYADESIGEEVFHEWMYNEKMDYLQSKLALDKKYKKDTTATETEIADAIIAENEYWNGKIQAETDKLLKEEKQDNKEREKDTKDHLEKIAQIRNEFGLDNLRLTYRQELELLKQKLAEEQATEEETARAIADFKKRLAEDYINDTVNIAGMASQALNNIVESQTMAVENKYAAQLKAAERAGQDTAAIEERMEEEKKAIKKKYAGIDFAITSAKIVAETASAIMEAAPNIPLQIATGILGATELGIAYQQWESVKNLWTGGYTGPGGKYEPKGIVHGNEFVANMDATSNRTLRKVFNVVDYAQKTNTVAKIDNDTIARALSIKQGFASGGYTSPQMPAATGGSGASTGDWSIMMSLIEQSISVNAALLSAVQDGIDANVSVTGNKGIKQATDMYNKLISNATRS